MYNHTKNVVLVGGGNLRGKYLKLPGLSPLFRYLSTDASVSDLTWAPEWVDIPEDATDFGGQAEDLISWMHRFKGEGEGFTWVTRQVVTAAMEVA